MSLPNAYSLKTSSIPKYFKAILETDIPQDFNANFMTSIGFRYAIDRSFIDILKELHFLCDSGMPTKRYTDLHGLTHGKVPLFEGIREAYDGLFEKFPEAQTLSEPQVVDALKPLYEGKKTDMMISGISATFVALCRVVDDFETMAAEVRRWRQAAKLRTELSLPPSAAQETTTPTEAAAPAVPSASRATASGEPPSWGVADAEDSEALVLGPEYEILAETQAPPPNGVMEPPKVRAAAAGNGPEALFPESGRQAATTGDAPVRAEPTPRQVEPEPLTLVLDTEESARAAAAAQAVTAAAAPEPEPLVLVLEPETPRVASAPDQTGLGATVMAAAALAAPDVFEPEPLTLVLETDAPGDAAPLHRDRRAAPAPLAEPLLLIREPDAPTAMDAPVPADAMPEPPASAAPVGHAAQEAAEPEPAVPVLEPDAPGEAVPSPAAEARRDIPLVLDRETPSPVRADADAKPALAQETSSAPAPAPTGLPLEEEEPATGAALTIPAAEAPDHETEPAATLDAASPGAAVAEPQDTFPRKEVPRPERPAFGPSLAFDIDLSPSDTARESSAAAASPQPSAGADDGAEKAQRRPLQIVLPESTDPAVYDAIFASLKRHLLGSDT